MRERLQGREISRSAWSLAVGAFVCLAGIALGLTRGTALVLGATAGFAVFLFVRLYSVGRPPRP
jgi:hypothetical protein